MKTIIYFTAKRARTPKMQGLATASGSAVVIRELCRMAKAGEGRVCLVEAPTAELVDAGAVNAVNSIAVTIMIRSHFG